MKGAERFIQPYQAGEQVFQEGDIDQARFVYLVSQQPAFALSVIRMMAQRLAGAGQQATATAVMEGA